MGETGRGGTELDRKDQRPSGTRDASFRTHFGTYLLFCLFFLVLNLLTDPGNWWFYWPIFGWGIGIVAHAFATYGADAPTRIVELVHDWGQRLVPTTHAPPARPPHRPTASPSPALPSEPRQTTTDFERIVQDGEAKVDSMRRQARRIPKADVRSQALDICASADRILNVLAENPHERSLADDFLTRYLAPAEAIVTRYTRQATRGVASAAPTLVQVEQDDLPLLDQKFRELYDRLHRGNLIDLEVARELLQLDFATAGAGETTPVSRD